MKRGMPIVALALLLGIGGCGGGGAESSGPWTATLVLDSPPNAVHVGIYAGQAKNLYRKAGIHLKIEPPGKSAVTRQLAAGRADFAILDIHDLGIAREQGLDLVGVMPIVRRTLIAVLSHYEGPIRRPRDLEGRTVGVSGPPLGAAVVDAEVKADGGDPSKVKTVPIGNAVSALASGKVPAVTAFWNAEGLELFRMNVQIRELILDKYGAPKYPELVLATSGKLLESDPDLVQAMVAATMRGYEFANENSSAALNDLLAANPSLSRPEQQERQSFVGSYIQPAPFNPTLLREWAAWDLENGILKKPLDVEEAFDVELARAEQTSG